MTNTDVAYPHYCRSCPCDRHDLYLPSIPASLQTLGRCECAAACALAPLGLRILGPLLSVNICRYRFFFPYIYLCIYMYTCIHKYIYRSPSCPRVCQTVGPFPISEFARLRSFTFHHPPRVCQTLSSSKSFQFCFWSIIGALPCPLLPIKGSGCHPHPSVCPEMTVERIDV